MIITNCPLITTENKQQFAWDGGRGAGLTKGAKKFMTFLASQTLDFFLGIFLWPEWKQYEEVLK